MDSWHSYPKVYNLGHSNITELFDGEVIVEEKVDGSQLSFGRFGDRIRIRSKGREFDIEAPDNLFAEAAESVRALAPKLREGWTYRGEYLKRPRHNGLHYDRIPEQHIMLFDINTGHETYLGYEEKAEEADRIGLEVVPLIRKGRVEHANELFEFMDRVSVLGGQKIEGLVAKNYARFGRDGKALMGKHVSEEFKEVQSKQWKRDHPTQGDIVRALIEEYRSPARWQKAVQHLRERGELEQSPKDIGALMREVQADIEEECKDEILEKLWSKFRKQVMRGAARGLPEWYKQKLLEGQFGG